MIFYPNTYVRLLTDVPLNNTYKDTLTFSSKQAQTDYFMSKTKPGCAYTDFTYQRYNPELGPIARIRINAVADNLYDCNYLMFRNNNFSEKWFYGFITAITFINPEVTEISYELDVMQTWKFDYQMLPSFVEREHTNDDTIGSNLVPETLELGQYKVSNQLIVDGLQVESSKIVIAASFDKSMNPSTGGVVGNVYSGLVYNVFDSAAEASLFILNATEQNKVDGIVSVFMYPAAFIPPDGVTSIVRKPVYYPKSYNNIDGYVPKNKKLFTYPYNFLYIQNGCGASAEFPYEYFTTNDCGFYLYGAMSCNPDFVLVPRSYKINPTGGVDSNYNEKFALSGFPQCSFVTDTYRAYIAQQASSLPVQSMATAFGTSSLTVGAYAAPIMSGLETLVSSGNPLASISSVYNSVKKQNEAASLPPQAHAAGGNETAWGSDTRNYTMYSMSVTAQFARIIDDYFTMFGYATNRVKTPNVTGRQNWNYVKTINMQLRGNIPADDIAKIKSVFDSGVTFWHNDNVGDYTRNNPIV